MKACHYCNQTEEEMRPYGPNASWICEPCATATPERIKQTEQNCERAFYEAAANSKRGIVVIHDGDVGPIPIENSSIRNDY